MKGILTLLSVIIISLNALAQGVIRGSIFDTETGDPLIGASVLISGTTQGTTTDLDGKYSIKGVEAGIYELQCSYISYQTSIVKDVIINEDQVTLVDFKLSSAEAELGNVVISAKALRNTESALLTIQKKSANVIDGVSYQAIVKAGDSDAAEAVQRVTGVSIEKGSYVYVRGLGDRYTKTTLNGMEIPGLDPDRNSVQMDLFPANLIDNLIVYKTFSPDLPGDFTGGMVNIETKDFPEQQTISASASFSYNPNVHFNQNFILYDQQAGDMVGFGKGQRKLPFSPGTYIPDPVEFDTKLTQLTSGFSQQMAVQKASNMLDQKYSLTFGNQKNREKATWGYNVALNYKNEYEFYDKVEYGEYVKDPDKSKFEIEPLRTSNGSLGIQNVLWSGLASVGLKYDKHKFGLTALHVQNGSAKAAKLVQVDNFNSSKLVKDNLGYTQRSISNLYLEGTHQLNKNIKLEWKNAVTYSQIADPDLRLTAFAVDLTNGDTTLRVGDGAQVNRIWRDLNEINNGTRADITFTFKQWRGLETKLKGGISNIIKNRNYSIYNNRFFVEGVGNFNGDADWLFKENNIWMPESRTGTYVAGPSMIDPANTYEARSNIAALYIMNELPLHEKLKAIYGFRLEKADNWYTGRDNTGVFNFVNKKVLDELDLLPSFSLVYNAIKNMNVRGAYTMTVARPSFRENSIAQIYDPILDRTYIGGIDKNTGDLLKETNITNLDLRWEYFYGRGEVISVSGFYKKFNNPIEIVAFETNPKNVQPRNVGNGTVLGIEFELKKNFSFISEKLKGFSVGANLTYVSASIQMSDEEYSGSNGTGGRLGNIREGEEIKDTRDMLGQSPYIINAFVNYSSFEVGLNINLSYNVQGQRLAVVGSGSIPDVYELPFNSLNFKISQKVGKEKRIQLSLAAENLIGDNKEFVYKSYQAMNMVYERYDPGRKFTVGASFMLK